MIGDSRIQVLGDESLNPSRDHIFELFQLDINYWQMVDHPFVWSPHATPCNLDSPTLEIPELSISGPLSSESWTSTSSSLTTQSPPVQSFHHSIPQFSHNYPKPEDVDVSPSAFKWMGFGQEKESKQAVKRLSELMLSEQNTLILENAFANGYLSTVAQISFLANCLGTEQELIYNWIKYAPKKVLPVSKHRQDSRRPVAQWKQKVIERGASCLSVAPHDQICMLSAGLRLDPTVLLDILQNTQSRESSNDMPLEHQSTGQLTPSPFELQPEHTDDAVHLTGSHIAEVLRLHSSQDALSEVKSPSLESMGDFNTDDVNTDDGCTDYSLEFYAAAILGPEYAHLAPVLVEKCPEVPEELSPHLNCSIRDTPGTSCSSPLSDTSDSSSSSRSFKQSSPYSTTASSNTANSQKRKSPDSEDSGGGGNDQSGDGDGDEGRDQDSKRSRKTQTKLRARYDCPIARRIMHMGAETASASSRGCAPGGLEFRNVW